MRIFIMLLFVSNLSAGSIASLMHNIEKKHNLSNALWSLSVSYSDGKKIYEKNPSLPLVPASALKIFTAAAAFDCLGKDYRLKTELYAEGKILDGVLFGDILLKGYGDITFASENFETSIKTKTDEIIAVIKEAGIKEVKGKIRIDDSFYSYKPLGSWAWEDISNYYAAFPSAFSVNDNMYSVCFGPDNKPGQPAKIEYFQPDMGLETENFVITANEGSSDDAYIYSLPWINKIRIVGTIPPGKYCIKGSMGSPKDFFAAYLLKAIKDAGLKVSNEEMKVKSEKKLLKTFLSPELKSIAAIMNKKSFNLYAEGLSSFMDSQCSSGGDKYLKEFSKKFLSKESVFNPVDACGLSRLNIVSSKDFTDMLNYAYKKEYFKVFYESLFYPGDPLGKGHIKRVDKKGLMGENLRVKSGSLRYVRAYAGYIKTKKGKMVSFAFMINNYSIAPFIIDEIFEALAYEIYQYH